MKIIPLVLREEDVTTVHFIDGYQADPGAIRTGSGSGRLRLLKQGLVCDFILFDHAVGAWHVALQSGQEQFCRSVLGVGCIRRTWGREFAKSTASPRIGYALLFEQVNPCRSKGLTRPAAGFSAWIAKRALLGSWRGAGSTPATFGPSLSSVMANKSGAPSCLPCGGTGAGFGAEPRDAAEWPERHIVLERLAVVGALQRFEPDRRFLLPVLAAAGG